MDLTPKHHWWRSIFHCCLPLTASSSACDGDAKEKGGERRDNADLVSTVPPLKVITSECKIADGDNIETPTTACTERSDGEELNCRLYSTMSVVDIPTIMYYIFTQQRMILSKGLMSTMTMMLVIPITLIIGMQIQSMSIY